MADIVTENRLEPRRSLFPSPNFLEPSPGACPAAACGRPPSFTLRRVDVALHSGGVDAELVPGRRAAGRLARADRRHAIAAAVARQGAARRVLGVSARPELLNKGAQRVGAADEDPR